MMRAQMGVLALTTLVAGTAFGTIIVYPPTISLDEMNATFVGESPGDEFGLGLALVDVNYDDHADLIVGAPFADCEDGSPACGRVYIFFGGNIDMPWDLENMASAADVVLVGAQPGDQLGTVIKSVYEVDGDSIQDLAISAIGADGGTYRGRVYLVFGRREGWESGSIDTIADVSIVGSADGERLGYSLAPVWDVNGDRIRDFVIGCWRYDVPGGDAWAGRASVVFGRSQEEWPRETDIETIAGASFVGETANELLGRSVSGVGNVNCDYWNDIVIGSPGDVGANSSMGRVSIIFGHLEGWEQNVPISVAADAIYTGEAAGDEAGTAVAMLQDIEWDGCGEIAVGAPRYSPSASEPVVGRVYLIRGKETDQWQHDNSLSDADVAWTGEAVGDRAGSFLSALGNLRNDGGVDLAVGAYRAVEDDRQIGKTYLLFLQEDTWTSSSDALADVGITFYGNETYAQFGYSVAGDIFSVNSGYADDLVFSAPLASGGTGMSAAGKVYLFLGDMLVDDDWDSYSPIIGDCDDTDDHAYPDAEEIPYDGIDQDCDGEDLVDVDGDGHIVDFLGEDDCNDEDPNINPDMPEVCNGIDDNCNLRIDENVQTAYYRDDDGDGYGTPDDEVMGCSAPEGYVTAGGDCDDADPDVHPGVVELCGDFPGADGVDDDCNGIVDDRDIDGDGSVDVACGGDDCDDVDANINPDAEDQPYDGIDQDCDGADFADIDGDGYAANLVGGPDCNDLDPDISPGAPEIACDGIDQDCNGVDLFDVDGDGFKRCGLEEGEQLDCDDDDPDTYPGAYDVATDDKDQNCDGVPAQDLDGDGYRTPDDLDCDDYDSSRHPFAEEEPYDGVDQDCDGNDLVDVDFDGFAAEVAGGEDCDDTDIDVYPGADEIPYDGVDQDCNGEDLADVDGDGYDALEAGGEDCDDTDPSVNPVAPEVPYNDVDENCDGLFADQDADGYYTYDDISPDCDDLDPDAYPGATEIPYDGVDQDCDGEDLVDVDGDGYVGWAAGGGDCNDEDPLVNPGAEEILDDGIDNDCDNLIDPDDMDGDGYSIAPSAEEPDCDDTNPDVNPGALEVPDLIDNNCDGRIDEHIVEGIQDPGGCVCSSSPGSTSRGDVLPFLSVALLVSRRRRKSR